jgi:hypothetical protein
MKSIKNWFRTLAAILFINLVVAPAMVIWVVLKIITLGEMKIWVSPASTNSWYYDIAKRIAGPDSWLLS